MLNRNICFVGAVFLLISIAFFCFDLIMLPKIAESLPLGNQPQFTATYGLMLKLVGTILMLIGIATLIYGITYKAS
jgi:hypothetical protein